MVKYAFSRILAVIPILFILSIQAFGLMHLAHGDPAVAMYGGATEKMRESDRERIRENLGLNQSLPIQYVKWLSQAAQGNLGVSYLDGRPVSTTIQEKVFPTLLLSFSGVALMIILSLFFGVISAVKQYSLFDHATTVISFLLFSIPSFWLALVLILVFSVYLGWLPSSGISSVGQESSFPDMVRHLLLPAIVLAVSHLGGYIRFLRSSMLDVLGQDYIKVAKARGIPQKTLIYLHALKNALLPFVTYLGLSLPSFFAGTFVVEAVFAWPGMGQLAMEAAKDRNYSVLMGTILFSGILVVACNLLADLICFLMDPRIRHREIEGHWGDING